MTFLCYFAGWTLYRINKWMGYLYSMKRKGTPVKALSYFTQYGPLIVRDLVIQMVIGLAWVTGMLDTMLTAAFTAIGFTMPSDLSPSGARAFATLVGYIVASVLSGVILAHMTPKQNGNGETE